MAEPTANIDNYLPEETKVRRDSLQSGDGGGTYDGMEARVARLEDDMKEVRSDLKAIRVDISEIKGKISNMPSTWQMIGICGGMLGLVIAGGAVALALVRLLTG